MSICSYDWSHEATSKPPNLLSTSSPHATPPACAAQAPPLPSLRRDLSDAPAIPSYPDFPKKDTHCFYFLSTPALLWVFLLRLLKGSWNPNPNSNWNPRRPLIWLLVFCGIRYNHLWVCYCEGSDMRLLRSNHPSFISLIPKCLHITG